MVVLRVLIAVALIVACFAPGPAFGEDDVWTPVKFKTVPTLELGDLRSPTLRGTATAQLAFTTAWESNQLTATHGAGGSGTSGTFDVVAAELAQLVYDADANLEDSRMPFCLVGHSLSESILPLCSATMSFSGADSRSASARRHEVDPHGDMKCIRTAI